MWRQNLEQKIQELKEKENIQGETEDKSRESQPKANKKQTLVCPVNIQQRPPDDDHPRDY